MEAKWKKGTDGVRTRDLRFTRPTPYHLATAPADEQGETFFPFHKFFPHKSAEAKFGKSVWQRWDSNPRLRRDWCLKPAP